MRSRNGKNLLLRVLSVFLRPSFFLFLLFPTPCHAGYNFTKSYRANFSCDITLYICALLKEVAYHNVLERNQMQVPRSSIFYVGIRVVSLRGKSYCTSLFLKVAFVNNNNGNFICVFECTIVNLSTYRYTCLQVKRSTYC